MQIDLMEAKVSQMRTGEARAAVRDLIAKVRELEQENALLREVVAEYNDCIRYMDAGGDFHEFQRITIDAARGGKEHG
ncbi:hypothetical protein K7G19_07330 [Cupriavidus sp. DB3]|uniref:hypothetical protein n=1 Tax=Cupriavidus sp. DB3 TaxID=2873259 RepID=UPI001CF15B6B|nr:hypothetical protein [Cupriavidus sp. DB3]MCA7083410.1 hypothetical protein [Cupriavidus sp. DB3]